MNAPSFSDGSRFHVAVFARAPVAGAAKTRLIPLLGAEGAAEAQRAMTLRALQTASAAAPGQVSLWTAGEPLHPFFAACADRFSLAVYPQPEGDLGERMRHCLEMLLQVHPRVILTGTDCPALAPGDLRQAARALRNKAKMVFAPAEDGGYVLVGARAAIDPAALESAFTGIDWSTDRVMSQTRERLAGHGWRQGPDWLETATCWDVDEPADYRRARAAGLLEKAADDKS